MTIEDTDNEGILKIRERLEVAVKEYNEARDENGKLMHEIPVDFSFGFAYVTDAAPEGVKKALDIADRKMYEYKTMVKHPRKEL